ncbi:MAG: hypothetical protein HYU63_00055 [Armatimonadetes bacterium]|nr:hypothetical protein [Armatimonadota bacterium]
MKCLAPFYLKIASLIKKELKEAEFYLLISPFLKKEKIFLKEILPDFKIGGIKGICQDNQILSQDGTKLEIINQNHYQIMQGCSFAITIPGTKTGELGVLGKAMLVILPLNRADIIPYIGLIGALDYLGNFGKYIKSIFLKKIAQNFGFISQPNILAQKEIVPEMMKELTPEEVACEALKLLKDEKKLETIQKELRELYKEHEGTSKRLVEIFLK